MFTPTVDSIVKNLVTTVERLDALSTTKSNEVVELKSKMISAENELHRAQKISDNLKKLLS